jgi:WD40 repeat protein
MSGKVTRGLCALAAGTALAAFTSVTAGTAGAAPGAARSLAAAETGHPAGAPGSQLWVQRYNGPGNGSDAASAVAVSPGGGRVFVTGASQGARSGPDYATVAYSAVTGARLWAARYNGPGNGSDAASAVAVSPGGSRVYVTGASQGTRSGPDYATVAYSAVTGARLWAARYNGPGNGSDAASAVAVSPDGSRVFVTGASRGATTTGYLTVAYRAATGARLWVQRYNGPGNGSDEAYSIAVSPGESRVFVTGASRGTRSGPDYATVAYSAVTGARLWVQRYNGPGNGSDEAYSIAVSPGGSRVFVTGGSRGTRSGPDYATVAYSAATGARLWVTRYNGPATYDDAARAVAVSPRGSTVYVTGGSNPGSATLAYSAATGAQLWLARHSDMLLAAVAVSPGGSRVYVTGLTGPFPNDYATVAHRAG